MVLFIIFSNHINRKTSKYINVLDFKELGLLFWQLLYHKIFKK